MRNPAFTLSPEQTRAASWARESLKGFDRTVVVNYRKRDGSLSFLRGEVVEIVGTGSNEAVVVKTDKGFRSANLWSVYGVSQ